MSATRVHDIPADICAASGFDRYDYGDLFVASGPPEGSPEAWARATMEGASAVGRFLAWQAILQLRLGEGADHIAGWRIVERGDSWIITEARSWFMTAHICFHVVDDLVSFATFVRYDKPIARMIWGPVSAIHRTVAPGFLDAGVRQMRRR